MSDTIVNKMIHVFEMHNWKAACYLASNTITENNVKDSYVRQTHVIMSYCLYIKRVPFYPVNQLSIQLPPHPMIFSFFARVLANQKPIPTSISVIKQV